jgi:glycosyltransferase involved in cell wall biosynthesis
MLQTYANWELLIVDDCSSDNTVDKILNFNDNRIRLFLNDVNRGLASCLNRCIYLSKGEYIARMDGDDLMIANRLEFQYDFLTKNVAVDVVGSMAYLIGARNEILGYKKSLNPANFKQVVLSQGFFLHPSVMGRKSWFLKFNYNSEFKRGQDLELWIRSYHESNFVNLNEYLIFYREIGDDYKDKYFKIHVALMDILKLHRNLIPSYIRTYVLLRSFLKCKLFYLFKYFGFVLKKQKLSISEYRIINNELIKIIK